MEIMAEESPQSNDFIRIVSYLFLAGFCVFLLQAVVQWRKYRLAEQLVAYEQGFVPIDAQVTQQEQVASPSGLSIVTHYKFTPPGDRRPVIGQGRLRSKLYMTQADAEAEIQARGKFVKVYYHPDHPQDSSFQPPARGQGISIWPGVAAVFFVCCAGVTAVFRIFWDRFWKHRDVASVRIVTLLVGLGVIAAGVIPSLISLLVTAIICYDFTIAGPRSLRSGLMLAVPCALVGVGLIALGVKALRSSVSSQQKAKPEL